MTCCWVRSDSAVVAMLRGYLAFRQEFYPSYPIIAPGILKASTELRSEIDPVPGLKDYVTEAGTFVTAQRSFVPLLTV